MPPLPPRRLPLITLALLLWLLLAVGGSWFLVYQSYQGFVRQSLLAQAGELGGALRTAGLGRYQETLDHAAALDRHLAYLMVWSGDGEVYCHSDHARIGSFLDPVRWPALVNGQSSRIAVIPSIAPHPSSTTMPGPLPALPRTAMLEATVILYGSPTSEPVGSGRSGTTYLSIAMPVDHLGAAFWESARPLLVGAGIFTLAGGVLLVLGIHAALRRLSHSRREIEQTALARTSLLTERGMLASVLAHEVRSPLTALRFNLHSLRALISADLPPAPAAPPANASVDKRLELTDRCEREIHRLDGMLNDFLLRTQVVSPPVPASLNTVIREALEFLAPTLERRNIHVSLHLDETEPQVSVHPDELRQVILNLAANAMEAMPAPKGGTLAISTLASATSSASAPHAAGAGNPTSSPAPNPPATGAPPTDLAATTSSITLLIRDSGSGIRPEFLERIFDPFFSTKPNGSGLGLTLVRRVISGAGGTIFVESTPGQGTTFRVLLPPSTPSTPATPPGQGYAHIRNPGPENID